MLTPSARQRRAIRAGPPGRLPLPAAHCSCVGRQSSPTDRVRASHRAAWQPQEPPSCVPRSSRPDSSYSRSGLAHIRSALRSVSRRYRRGSVLRVCAITGREQVQQQHRYSITSSAVDSNAGGTVMSSIRAVSALMTSSNFDDCSTGKSAGFSPLRMRPT
jgi:hypothetical protein